MNDDSDKGGAVVAIGLIVIILLIVGTGIYFFVVRQHTALAVQAAEALRAEAVARMQAERARAASEAAIAAQVISPENESSAAQDNSIRSAVESVLRAQEAAWNRGDIDAFVEHYWKSESLTFSSGGKTTRGWTATLNRYRERYPTREKMGRLTLSGPEITPLGDTAALVLGQWKLERAKEPVSGNFSLVLRKIDNRWLIVHDHTSQATE
jgi:beta-aspartyl-peptidase (threonine type)